MKFFFIFLFLCDVIFAEPIGFSDAWLRMLSVNDGLKSEKQGEKQAKMMKEAAKSMYLPSINFTGSYTHIDKGVDLDVPSSNIVLPIGSGVTIPQGGLLQESIVKQDIFLADLNVLWPLYTGGKIRIANDLRTTQISEARARTNMAKDKAFVTLVKVYYGVLMGEALLQTRLEVEKALALHYKHAKKLKEQGQIAQVELLNAKVRYDKAKIETTKARHSYEIASSTLKKLLKSQKLTPSSHLFVNFKVEKEAHYESAMQENHPALKLLNIKKNQSEMMVKMNKGSYHPTLAAYGNYNLYKDDSLLFEALPKWFVGVGVKWTLFDNGGRSEKLEVAKIMQTKVAHIQAQARTDLSILLEKSYKEMRLYLDEYRGLNSSLALAGENVRLRERSFTEGLSTSIDVIDAQLFLASIKTERLNAAYNYVKKLSQVMVLSGERDNFIVLEKKGEVVKQ